MKYYNLPLLLLITVCTLCSGCSKVFYTLYGINEQKKLSDEEIVKMGRKYGVDTSTLFIADSDYYKIIKAIASKDSAECSLLLQPLQIKVYSRMDSIVAFQANCQIGGFPNLQWNKYNHFSKLPPENNHIRNSQLLHQDISSFKRYKNHPVSLNNGDYTMVVVWTVFMKRQSKRMIKFAKSIPEQHPDKKFSIIYLNVENFYFQ